MVPIKQVILCGSGGHGIVLAGTILGRAAFSDGMWVSGTNSYGASARGGACRAEVVISGMPIVFPYVIAADTLITMSQTAHKKYIERVKLGEGIVIYDERFTPEETKNLKHVGIPATETAVEGLGNGMVANIIILSAAVAMTGVVTKESLDCAIRGVVPERLRQLNLEAMDTGFRLARTRSNQIQRVNKE